MKLYCGFKLSDSITSMVESAMDLAEVEAPLQLAPKDRIHVTTAFLGDMMVEQAVRILKSAASVDSFYAYVGKPSTFTQVLYLGVISSGAMRVQEAQAVAYHKETGRALWPANYMPHVTLAKCEGKTGCRQKLVDAMARIADFDAGSCLVEQLHLFHKSEILATIDLREAKSWT